MKIYGQLVQWPRLWVISCKKKNSQNMVLLPNPGNSTDILGQ